MNTKFEKKSVRCILFQKSDWTDKQITSKHRCVFCIDCIVTDSIKDGIHWDVLYARFGYVLPNPSFFYDTSEIGLLLAIRTFVDAWLYHYKLATDFCSSNL
ncbi:unnamed protein product [Albugo candida]|uniref:Uncharacterized protein n=1 Tax=Albugo candida TaxID=65357 RepID=A0A024FWI8_9STRA|nr:unnamed protein product [Albugo candida]|eukprot:CCI11302.1 unnamed protein product [Albugo candida]